MSAYDDFEKRRKQVLGGNTTPASQSSGAGAYSDFEKRRQAVLTAPAPVVSKSSTPVSKPVAPQNFFQQAVEKAKQVASNIASNFKPKVAPKVVAPPLVQKQNTQTSSAIKSLSPDFGNTFAPSATLTVTKESLIQQQKTVQQINEAITNVKTRFPGSSQLISEISTDPFSFNKLATSKNPSDYFKTVINDGWQAIKPALDQEKTRIIQYVKDYYNPNASTVQKKGSELSLLTGTISTGFAPISAAFSILNDVPVLGSISKMITLPFSLLGEGGSNLAGKIVDEAPLPESVKTALKPGLQEAAALAAQIWLGKVTHIETAKKAELVKKYGVEDTNTIIKVADKMVEDRKNISTPEKIVLLKEEGGLGNVEQVNQGIANAPEIKPAENAAPASPAPQKTITVNIEAAKQKVLTTNEAKAIQVNITERLNHIRETASTSDEIVSQVNDLVKEVVDKSKGDRAVLSGLRTALNKEMFGYVGDNGNSYKANFAILQELKKADPEMGKVLTTYENHISTIDNALASATTPKSFEVPVRPEGQGVSKIGISIERKAIEQGLTKKYENLAEYDKITIADQGERAAKAMQDIETARKIIRGEEPLPSGLRGTALITAAEEYVRKTGDGEVFYELANSPLVSKTSYSAQELRLAAERTPDSIELMARQLRQIREESVKRATGKTVNEVKQTEIRKIKAEIQKNNPDVMQWNKFLDSIQC